MVFRLTDHLSTTLQSSQLSGADGQVLANSVVDELVELRSESAFNRLMKEVDDESEKLGNLPIVLLKWLRVPLPY